MSNITVNFTPPSPSCINGYKILYRKVGDSTYTTLVPNVFTSPATITGVDLSFAYEGSIESDCSNNIFSNLVTFSTPACVGSNKKIINGQCTTGSKQYLTSVANVDPDTGYTCTYRYFFADGTQSATLSEQSPIACI